MNASSILEQVKGYKKNSILDVSAKSAKKRYASSLAEVDLVVNAEPDLPLAVPLNFAALPASETVEILKKKNLERFETVAKNLEL